MGIEIWVIVLVIFWMIACAVNRFGRKSVNSKTTEVYYNVLKLYYIIDRSEGGDLRPFGYEVRLDKTENLKTLRKILNDKTYLVRLDGVMDGEFSNLMKTIEKYVGDESYYTSFYPYEGNMIETLLSSKGKIVLAHELKGTI